MAGKSEDRGLLGQYLWDVRNARGMTLRQVEEACDVSNAYLSQLETGKIKQPSPHILHELAEVYNVPYETLMEKAGYIKRDEDNKAKGRTRKGRAATFAVEDLTDEEEAELLKYLAFLRTRKS